MILITGATGNLGKSVVKQLEQHLSKDQFILTSSKAETVAALIQQGYQARIADFNDIDTLHTAFQGVSKLLLISTMEQNRADLHDNVIDAAKAQGVEHIVYTRLAIKDIHTSAVKELMMSHFQTESYLMNSGINYTILRNTMYADALVQILGPQALMQDIQLPGGNGRVPYVLRREMGEATANLLLQDGHEQKIYHITHTKSYSYADIAAALTQLTHQRINYVSIPEDQFHHTLAQNGFPEFLIYLHAGTINDIKAHQYEIEDTTLATLLGRTPADLMTFLKELFNI